VLLTAITIKAKNPTITKKLEWVIGIVQSLPPQPKEAKLPQNGALAEATNELVQ
jgi:hypothetical protein